MITKGKNTEKWAILAIVICSLLWGFGFPAMKMVEELNVYFIISVRFIVASVLLSLIFIGRFKKTNKTLLLHALILSFVLFVVYVFATLGIKFTTSAKASFFSCLTFAIIPFLNLLVYKQKITKIIAISVGLCLVGIFLLSYSPVMGFNLALGDIICIGASLFSSIYIVMVDKMTKKDENDPVLLSIWMMIFIAIFGTIVAFFRGSFSLTYEPKDYIMLLVLGVFCTAIPYILQFIGQEHVHSTRVGLINALEPTSGAILSVILIGETLGITGWIGGAIVIISLIYMELMNSRGK